MKVLSQIKEEIQQCEIVSFDIFDTLILRPYYKPVDVFSHIERIWGLKKFAKKRINAENEARKLSSHDEITHSEIYQLIGQKFKYIRDVELEFEKRICQKNPEIYKLYDYALKLGKKVIIVSDMYLPQGLIEDILNKNDYNSYDHLFLSSTYKKRKATGGLFDVVLEKMDTPPEKILHIGDNRKNDFENAITKGLKAIYYPKIIDRFMHDHKNMSLIFRDDYDKRFDTDNLTYSLIVGINAIIWVENQNDSYWTRFGTLYAGPFLYFFTKWLYNKAQSNQIKNIALVARDGYNLKKLFEIFDNKNDLNFNYVYLPRLVSESANINSRQEIEIFFEELGKTDEALHEFILNFSEESEQVKNNWNEFIKQHKHPTYNDMKSFVLDNSLRFIEISQKKKEIVYDYFCDMGLLSGNLMIVDSSCTKARPQKLLNNIIKSKGLSISLFGYYYKVNKRSENLDQTEIRPEANRKYQTDKWDLMEFFMSSPEKPIISIKKEGNHFKPVYKNIENSKYEKHRIKQSELLSEGVVKFAKRAYDIFDDIEIIKDLDTVVAYVNNIINNPTNKDIAHIKHMHHSPNNDNNYIPLILKDASAYLDVRKIYGQRVQVKRITPEFENFFIGGGHRQIINTDHHTFLSLNVPFMDKLPSPNDEATICLIDDGEVIDKIDKLVHWNFQMGSVVQFRPGHKNQIIYNGYNESKKNHSSIIHDFKTRVSKDYDSVMLNISNDGKWAVSIDSLTPCEQEYPYAFGYIKPKYEDVKNENYEDQFLYVLDLDKAYKKRVLSINKIIERFGELNEHTDCSNYYFRLITINPNASRIFVQIERKNEKIGNKILSFSIDVNGNAFYPYNSQISNVQWKDNKNLIVTSSNISGKLAQDYESLYEIEDLTSEFEAIDKKFFSKGGNFSYHPNGRYLVYDRESSNNIPYRNLQLYDLHDKRGINLGLFHSDPELYTYNRLMRCELRPRWSPCGKYITFDSIHEGYKGVYQISGEEAIKELDREIESLTEEEVKKIIGLTTFDKNHSLAINISQKVKQNIKIILKYFIRGNARTLAKKIIKKI